MAKHLYVFEGQGRCAGTTTYVLGTDETDARNRLLRDDASPHYQIGSVHPFSVTVTAKATAPKGERT
jgi:hypothetical protein